MKLRIQFGLAFTLGGLVVFIEAAVLFSLGSFYLNRFGAEVDRRLDESLEKPGVMLTQGALSIDAFGQRDTLRSVVGAALEDAMVASADGVVLVALESERVGHRWSEFSNLKTEWLRLAASGGFTERLTVGQNTFLIRVAPVTTASGNAPVLFTYVRLRTTENERELAKLRVRVIGGSVVALIVSTVMLLWAINYLVTRRLRRIARAVEQVTEGNYDSILGQGRLPDEIGFLQAGVVAMTDRLREAFAGQRQAFSALEQAEKKYRVLVENADESIVVVQGGKIAFANTKSHQMLAVPADTLVSRSMLDYVHQAERAMVEERLAERIPGAAPAHRSEFRMVSSTGQTLWVELNVVMIDWKGAPATLNFLRDISQRKQAEEERAKLQSQLTQAKKMESIGRLAGGVAHDFNNMLQVILGHATLAMLDVPPGSPLNESLGEIEKSAKRSADLTRQLLTFARKQAIMPQVLALNEVIEGMLKMLRRLIGENIHLVWLPGDKLWPVSIDPSQVDQILANLCVNARDVILDSGRISIETINVTLDDTYTISNPDCLPGEYVMLSVSDSGHGMDTETLAHVFEPFFTTKEVGQGTGLGLATVFGIVKQNRGLINVYSERDKGTTFKIYFPRGEGTPLREIAIARPIESGHETVLIVEDEDSILRLAQMILSKHGYNVLIASTPQAAMELSASYQGPIHLLMTDVVMPGMNGKELKEQLKTQRRTMKYLFMSGYTADIIAHHGVLDSDVEFIQKPFTIQSLTEKVRQVLQK